MREMTRKEFLDEYTDFENANNQTVTHEGFQNFLIDKVNTARAAALDEAVQVARDYKNHTPTEHDWCCETANQVAAAIEKLKETP